MCTIRQLMCAEHISADVCQRNLAGRIGNRINQLSKST
jgi:hypothetical protein